VNLPILIGQFVPSDDEHYYCFLTLLAILAICVATSVTAEDACLLATMTEDHHHRFCNLYPDQPVTPKMHYMVHLPSQLLSFGPLRTMWCMRFEAKNGHFKRLVKGNFKNIALSLAKQSQLYMCHRLLSSQDGSSSYLSKEDIVLSGKTVDFTDHPLAEQLLQTLGLNHQRALWVFRCLQVCLFDDHFYSYEVRQTSKITLISCNSLMQDDCSCIRKVADRLLVTERIPLVHHIPGL
jgi:hypothetical protein